MNNSVFEPIEHKIMAPAKIFVTGMESSHYHWHYDYELVVLLKGKLQVLCGPSPMLMEAGDIFLVNSKMVHGYRGVQDNLCLFIQFPTTIFERIAGKEQLLYFYLNSVRKQFPPKGGFERLRKAACKAGFTIYGEEPEAYLVQNASFYELMAELAASVQFDIRRYPGYADSPAAVPYTNLTLPTSGLVEISGGGRIFTKKQKKEQAAACGPYITRAYGS